MTETEKLSTFIREAREKAGYTPYKMAQLLNYNRADYAKIERGEKDPRASILFKLAEILGLEIIMYDKADYEF